MPWGDSPSIFCDLTAVPEGSDSGPWATSAADRTIGLASPQGSSRRPWAEWVIEKGPGATLAVVTMSAAAEETAVCLGKAEAPGNPGTWGPAGPFAHQESWSLQLPHKYLTVVYTGTGIAGSPAVKLLSINYYKVKVYTWILQKSMTESYSNYSELRVSGCENCCNIVNKYLQAYL